MQNPINSQVTLNTQLNELAIANEDLALKVAEQAQKASESILATKRLTDDHHCTASIGVVLFDENVGSGEDILEYADKAMYQAKEAGRNRIQFSQEVL